MSHHVYCVRCASYACPHVNLPKNREKHRAKPLGMKFISQIGYTITTILIFASVLGSLYFYYTGVEGQNGQDPFWRWTKTDYTRADWIASYTNDEHVLNTRWYAAPNCPIKRKDWPSTTLRFHGTLKAKGIYSASGYICIPANMEVSPKEGIVLHELAHAVAWEIHGHNGHGETFVTVLNDVERHYGYRR